MAADRPGNAPIPSVHPRGGTITHDADTPGARSVRTGGGFADTDAADVYAFGEDVPTEEGGVVAMAGWSLAALVSVAAIVTVMVTLVVMRRRRRMALPHGTVRLAPAA